MLEFGMVEYSFLFPVLVSVCIEFKSDRYEIAYNSLTTLIETIHISWEPKFVVFSYVVLARYFVF